MKFNLKSLLGVTPWSETWQKELANTVQEAQAGLAINMVVVVTHESDIYAELLFILSFFGMSVGALLAYFLKSSGLKSDELLAFPLAGFALGATVYTFRKFYIHKIAARAVRERVTTRAKAQFFDYQAQMDGSLTLTYFSELEREVLFLTSPEINNSLPQPEIQELLATLLKNYDERLPMKALGPCLRNIGKTLRQSVPEKAKTKTNPTRATSRYFLGASDRPSQPLTIPIIKGNKDIN